MPTVTKEIVKGIQCPRCSEKLWSKYVHDFHYCKCEYCFIDGGREYLRYGWGVAPERGNTQLTTPEEWDRAVAETNRIGVPVEIDIEVTEKPTPAARRRKKDDTTI